MLCPSCNENNNKVIDSRLTEGQAAIRRRRVCLTCNRRFTTKERLERELRLAVIKADGRRVSYNRESILHGIVLACHKLEIDEGRLEEIVDAVEEDLLANHERHVGTDQIGLYVGSHLRRLNQVAYVRFMSVHRKYRTIDEFVEEISDVRALVSQDNPDQQSLFDA